MRIYKFILMLLLTFLMCGCSNSNIKEEEYGYVHYENTGITNYLLKDGREIPIQFHRNSEQLALKSLNALSWRILLLNADGKHIILRGKLLTTKHRTPSALNMAKSEEYFEFELKKWYIITPLKEIVGDKKVLGELSNSKKEKLDVTDFEDFPGKEMLEVRSFGKDTKKYEIDFKND